MIITKKEVTDYIMQEIKDTKLAENILDATVKVWFPDSSRAEVDFTTFCKYVIRVLTYSMTTTYIECGSCGYQAQKSNFKITKEIRESGNKKINWNEEKHDYELIQKEYELEFYTCPACGEKLLLHSTPL